MGAKTWVKKVMGFLSMSLMLVFGLVKLIVDFSVGVEALHFLEFVGGRRL